MLFLHVSEHYHKISKKKESNFDNLDHVLFLFYFQLYSMIRSVSNKFNLLRLLKHKNKFNPPFGTWVQPDIFWYQMRFKYTFDIASDLPLNDFSYQIISQNSRKTVKNVSFYLLTFSTRLIRNREDFCLQEKCCLFYLSQTVIFYLLPFSPTDQPTE